MKRKKTEGTPKPEKSAKFWPVPGVDGEPYPPLVQEALDLVEKETRRRKISECKHEGRYPAVGFVPHYNESIHVCACRSCGAKGPKDIACLPSRQCDPEVREYRKRAGLQTPAYGFPYEQGTPRRTDRHVSRQVQRASAWDLAAWKVQRLLEESRQHDEGTMRRSITWDYMLEEDPFY